VMRRMLSLGVDGLMTDRAELLRDLLRAESVPLP
jgi:glycerophosphoryl diester phosphodiesterase